MVIFESVSLVRKGLRENLKHKILSKVRCQIHEMSSAEKRKLKKQVGSTTITTGHVATLIYLGSEKRPKSGMFKSNDFKIKNTHSFPIQ